MINPKEILIVEDEAFTAMSLRLELEKTGHIVCSILATGEQAILFTANHHPDVILMDIRLAGKLDGIEAAEQIIALKYFPIIFMTGYDDKKMQKRARKLNPVDYIIKPVALDELKSIIDSV